MKVDEDLLSMSVEQLRETVMVLREAALVAATQKIQTETGPRVEWCDNHRSKGGATNCLLCACEEMSSALAQIDEMVDPWAEGNPPEYMCSTYTLDCNPQAVADRVRVCSFRHQASTFTQRVQVSFSGRTLPAITFQVGAEAGFPLRPDTVSFLLGHAVSKWVAPEKSTDIKSTVEPWPLPDEWGK